MNQPSYRDYIGDLLAGKDSGVGLLNTHMHTATIAQEAFRRAAQSVRILVSAGNASRLIDPVVLSDLIEFVSRPDTCVDILLEQNGRLKELEGIQEMLSNIGSSRIRVNVVPKALCSRYTYNFMIVDSCAYRFQEDREVPAAIVSGGPAATKQARILEDLFEKLSQSVSESTLNGVSLNETTLGDKGRSGCDSSKPKKEL